jgi:AcrR family transcriptional regulator
MSTVKFATEIRREQIAQAALELITTQGIKAFNVARLAQRVGFAPSAIYHHFKGKDEILDAVLDLLENKLRGNVSAVREKTRDPLDQLRRLLAAHAQLVLGYSALPRILFSEDVYGGNSARKARFNGIIMSYLQDVANIIRNGQEIGLVRADPDPATLSVMFLGLLQPTAILWHLSDGKFDAAKQVERAWPVFLDAIRARSMDKGNNEQ